MQTRTCPHHPNVVISSPCGLFDGLCGPCEHAASIPTEEEAEAELAAHAAWRAEHPEPAKPSDLDVDDDLAF